MFVKLGSLIVNRKKLIFSIFIVAILSAGVIGSSVFGKLDSGGYNNPKSDSSKETHGYVCRYQFDLKNP